MFLSEIFVFNALLTLVFAWMIRTALNGLYNLYWHPLAKFPGPKLASFSLWWKIYWEVVMNENLLDKLVELHSAYGDIIRIAPNELHFAKPAAFHDIHNPRNKWAKDPILYHAFAEAESSLSICDYRKAKARKDILAPFFSRKTILGMQHLVQDCIDGMCTAMENIHNEGKSINIQRAFHCVSVDTITSFCFAKSLNALKEPEFRAPVEQSMSLALPMVTRIKYLPVIKTFTSHCPPALLSLLQPQLVGLIRFRALLKDQVDEVTKNPEALQSVPHPVIYHALLNPTYRQKLSDLSLRDEALLLVFAGTDTSKNVLTAGIMHVLSNLMIRQRLKAEILAAWPSLDVKPRFEDVERLPYLSAVLKEALRMAGGPMSSMTRIVPQEGAEINGISIPGGTIVGISMTFVHMDDKIFPSPCTFDPERWLGPGAEGRDHWLVPFSRGPRSCIGTNLAWCEMYLAFANLFRRFDLELDGVSAADLRYKEDYLPHHIGPDLLVRATPCSV